MVRRRHHQVLMEKMDLIGIVCDEHCTPGKYYCLFCPKCKGGRFIERSLSLHVIPTGDFAMWRCFQSECGWAGRIFADGRLAFNGFSRTVKTVGRSARESLVLEPLGDELISYFNKRMISQETLERNVVMQIAGRQVAIAFTYRQNGQLVGCKYRTMDKRFWQEKGTEKLLYGIDDINDANELIIVEGEMDKLSVEEAGLLNCISVPGGAPSKVSTDTVPSNEKDTAYQYLWSCKDYLDKVSRIILATDSDEPGQALAEELARRLGKHRCWRVDWPYKDDFNRFKDANEILMHLGPDALKNAIQDAKFYELFSSNQIKKEEDLKSFQES
ncbi:twinkle homolog protein, chloroplastic/mitochondrial isoform X3 [Benincasa hispida]|uniref:twinkle homolog protein, chloroplastic/mitochondrial isoform X3 n=1 Tax=Benincasa hispida TaxID=102211 RepID=UPI0018FF91B3|nr:twinkle homolog protein, chloroplastic/mitochondrial isoform X3 [Benincasa hispida]